MPVAYRVRAGTLPACPMCSLVGEPHLSIIEKPSWAMAPRTSSRELAKIKAARELDLQTTIAAMAAAGVVLNEARRKALQEVGARHPETGWQHWLLRGCEHAKSLCEWPTRETQAIEAAWAEKASRGLQEQAVDRRWSQVRVAKVAAALGFVADGELPALMACPKCADALFADRVRPILTELADGRWQIAPTGGCTHITDSEKSRGGSAQELAERWNTWAARKLEERLASADLAEGVKGCFAAAVAAR